MGLVEAAASIDVISPLLSVMGALLNGPSYTFLIPYNQGWSGRDTIRLLKRHGVKSWGHMVVDNTLMISVREDSAAYAQSVLKRRGILVENPYTENTRRRFHVRRPRGGTAEGLGTGRLKGLL